MKLLGELIWMGGMLFAISKAFEGDAASAAAWGSVGVGLMLFAVSWQLGKITELLHERLPRRPL